MRICLVSDLHVDIGQQPELVLPEADVLCVAGDTANSAAGVLRFLDSIKGKYEHVLFVDGNHEHYFNATLEHTVDETNSQLLNIANEFGAVFLSARTESLKIGDLYFVGRNGWYSFDYAGDPEYNKIIWPNEIQDNRFVGFGQIEQTQPWDLAVQHAAEINSMIAHTLADDPDARFVVMSHVAPHRQLVSQDPRFIRSNPFFVNTHFDRVLEHYGKNIEVWQYGHTHFRTEKVIDGTYCIANPRGYPSENKNWEPVVLQL